MSTIILDTSSLFTHSFSYTPLQKVFSERIQKYTKEHKIKYSDLNEAETSDDMHDLTSTYLYQVYLLVYFLSDVDV